MALKAGRKKMAGRVSNEVLAERLDNVHKDLGELKDAVTAVTAAVRNDYVTRTEFTAVKGDYVPRSEYSVVKSIVFWCVGVWASGSTAVVGFLIWNLLFPK